MIQWPWPMIFLVLISTVQWTCIRAQYPHEYNLTWPGYSFLKTTPTTVDRFEHGAIVTTNTKLGKTREQLSNNSTIRVSEGLKPPKSNSSYRAVFTNSTKEAVHTISVNTFTPDRQTIDKCSNNDSYCDKVDNYPTRQVLQQIFRTSKSIASILIGDDDDEELEIKTRVLLPESNVLQPKPICDSIKEIIYPKASIDENEEWRFIVQDQYIDNNVFRQGIIVEKCKNPGNQSILSEHLPSGYITTCVQKYIYRKLVAINDSKEMYYGNFKLPCCCACVYNEDIVHTSELLTNN